LDVDRDRHGDRAHARSSLASQEATSAAAGVDLHTYEVVTNSITDMVSVADESGVCRLVNDAWCRNTGRSREQVLGRPVFEVLDTAVTAERRLALQECIERHEIRRVRDRLPIQHLAGRCLETTFYPFVERVQGLRCAVIVTRDVTEQEESRVHLQASSSCDVTDRQLAQEALTAAKEEAERANHAKSRFMSQMSHELRTPMNAILGFGQLLQSDADHPLTDVQLRYVDEILRGGRHLLSLIDDVLDLGRVETGRLAIDPAPGGLQPPTAPAQAATGAADRTICVLYIEDNQVNAILMEAMLTRLSDVEFLHAAHPAEGLALARERQPDLILLDIQLPDMDGFEVLRHLRADPRTRATPAIAVSAGAMAADVRTGLAAGFADYLTKPLEITSLLAAVRKAIGLPAQAGLSEGTPRKR